jgi:hypothetical protein
MSKSFDTRPAIDYSIQARIWNDTLSRPDTAGILAADVNNPFSGGLVGVTTHSGSSLRYWGPITVTSNRQAAGAYMAYETFHQEDSIVDVSPFTPVSWHPDYGFGEFVSGPDSTGFVLDTADSGSLIYRHKPGVTYPVTCRLIPETNLEWRDYEFSGTIVKPQGDVYDSIEVGAVFYAESPESYYKLVARGAGNGGNRFVLMRGEDSLGAVGNVDFSGSTDTVHFAVQTQTDDYITALDTIPDGQVTIRASVWAEGDNVPGSPQTSLVDVSTNRRIDGQPGLVLNLNESSSLDNGEPVIMIRKAYVRKERQ